MKRKIRLTESELTTLIKRMVEQAQDDMRIEYNEDDDMEYGEEQEELSKPEAVDLIADFFKSELLPNISSEDKSELKHMAREVGPEINEHYLNEDLKSRFLCYCYEFFFIVNSDFSIFTECALSK